MRNAHTKNWVASARFVILQLCVVAGFAAAQTGAPASAPANSPASFSPREFVTHHEGVFGGKPIRYTAIAADTVLSNDAGSPAATIFSFSYIRDDVKDRSTRPVFFVFNGGPGSSSIWLHLGFFGPRRVAFADAVNPPPTPPFSLQDNPYTILDLADVVLIDPVGTGFSHLLPAGNAKQFYGVEQDGGATVEFIEAWLTKQGRMNSPKFVVGESYGVTRAIVVARMLMGGPFSETGRLTAIPLDGVVIMGGSPTENFVGKEAGDLTYVNALPTMAATAWYHKKAGRAGSTLESVIAEAQSFAGNEYLRALYTGDRLDTPSQKQVAEHLAALTGLPADFILQKKLRVSMEDFRTELLLEKGLVVGAYDSRFTLPALDEGPMDPVADDPAMGKFSAAFIGAMDMYLRDELKIKVESPYEAIAFKSVNGVWDYGPGSKPGGPSTRAQDLAAVMRRNSRMQLLSANGAYDCVSTVGGVTYGIAHSSLPLERVSVRTYAAGHMVYLGDAGSAALAADLRKLVASALNH